MQCVIYCLKLKRKAERVNEQSCIFERYIDVRMYGNWKVSVPKQLLMIA